MLRYDDSAYGYVGRGTCGLLAAWLALVAGAVAASQLRQGLGPILPAIRPEISAVRWGLRLPLACIAAAQAAMGSSWRVGTDRTTRTELVQTGLFGYSRNPIFLGMRVILLVLIRRWT